MKYIMKKFLTVIMTVLALSLVMSSCVKDKMFVGDPSISSIVFSPTSVTPYDEVTVSATLYDLSGIKSATVNYKVNGGSSSAVAMTASGNTYSAKIPVQADKAVVAFTITATSNNNRITTSVSQSYTVGIQYGELSDIRLNELNSSTKFIEIYNPTSKPIVIGGIKFAKNAADAYFVDAAGATIQVATGTVLNPKSYAIMGCKGADLSSTATTAGALYLGTSTTGLSGSKSLLVIMQDKDGNKIDSFVNSAIATPAITDTWDGAVEYTFTDASRVPDGSGDFYSFTDGTPGLTNGTTTSADKFTHKLN